MNAKGKKILNKTDGKPKTKKAKAWAFRGKSLSEKELWKMDWTKQIKLMEKIEENINKTFSFGTDGDVVLTSETGK